MVDSREWRKGAVKRLASIYDGIARASARNLELMSDVSRALKDGAAAVKQSRRTSSGVRSRKSAFESLGEEVKQGGPPLSPAPNVDIKISKVRNPSGGPSVLRKAPKHSSRSGASSVGARPDTTADLNHSERQRPANGLSTLPIMLPTPPDSPSETEADEALYISKNGHPDADSPTACPPDASRDQASVDTSEPFTPREAPCSSPLRSSGELSLQDPSHPRSMNQSSIMTAQSYTAAFTAALAQTSADQFHTPAPRIRVRDMDDINTPSRDVSLSSVFAGGFSSDQHCFAIKTPQSMIDDPAGSMLHAGTLKSETDLDIQLASLRTSIVEALESDTSALVDAVRTFVGSLHEITEYLSAQGRRTGTPGPCDQDEIDRLCTQAREDLQTLRHLIDTLKKPRGDMLQLARTGPSSAVLPSVSRTWSTLSLEERIKIIHNHMSLAACQHHKHSHLEQVLTAVMSEKGNEEFLSKVEGWETGVKRLEEQFGDLLA